MHDRWVPGHCLGKSPTTDEHLVSTSDREVVRARSVRVSDEPIRAQELAHIPFSLRLQSQHSQYRKSGRRRRISSADDESGTAR